MQNMDVTKILQIKSLQQKDPIAHAIYAMQHGRSELDVRYFGNPNSFFRGERQELFDSRRMQRAILCLSLDAKIDRDGRVKLAEVNGADSGIKGMWALGDGSAGLKAEKELVRIFQRYSSSIDLPFLLLEPHGPQTLPYFRMVMGDHEVPHRAPYDKNHETVLSNLGRLIRKGFGSQGEIIRGRDRVFRIKDYEKGKTPRFAPDQHGIQSLHNAEALVWNRHPGYYRFDDGRFVVVNPFAINAALEDKELSAILLEGLDMHPSSIVIGPETNYDTFVNFLDGVESDRIIVKPTFGYGGKDISTYKKGNMGRAAYDALKKWATETGSRAILSEYVYSDFSVEGKKYEPCMRFLAVVSVKDGNISRKFYPGAYWRVPTTPFDPNDEASLIANLKRGAFSCPVSDKDFDKVRRAFENDAQTLVDRLVTFPMYSAQHNRLYVPHKR